MPSGSGSDYRSISLTCVACKTIMESVIAKLAYMHIDLADNNLLSHCQHGFIGAGGHSACTKLLECFNDWTYSCIGEAIVASLTCQVE